MSRKFWRGLAAALALFGGFAAGDERFESVLRGEISDDQIAALVEQLDHPAFANRQAASEQLEEAGSAAVVHLETTAAAGSREAASRALAILKQHFQTGTGEAKLHARRALEALAQDRDVSTSQRARDVLNPPRPIVAASRFGPPPAVPAPPIVNNFGRANAANAGGFRRVSISDINGRKVVEIDDRERRVKMETLPAGNIEVEVTDKQNGGNPIRKIDAKDLGELRSKDAELGRLYEQYQRPAAQLGGPPALGVAPLDASPPPALNPTGLDRLQVQTIEAMLNRYRQKSPADPATLRMIDSLEQTKARLEALQREGGAPPLVR